AKPGAGPVASTAHKRLTRRTSGRRGAMRARHSKEALASADAEDEVGKVAATDDPNVWPPPPSKAGRKAAKLGAPRLVDGSNEPSEGFSAIWKQRTALPATPVELARPAEVVEPAADPAPADPMQAAAPAQPVRTAAAEAV